MEKQTGTLSILATPIGNLEDITLRALRVLQEADVVLCEDTRVTGKLLAHYEIKKELKRCDAEKEDACAAWAGEALAAGKRLVYVSDAGTPGVSDPGGRLVARIRATDSSVCIESIPGPSSVTAALAIAGLDTTAFTFLGFAPHKKGRQTFFTSLADFDHPLVFFESTHRIMKTLQTLVDTYPRATLRVARELTKLHEELLLGTPAEIFAILSTTPEKQKGEFVIILDKDYE